MIERSFWCLDLCFQGQSSGYKQFLYSVTAILFSAIPNAKTKKKLMVSNIINNDKLISSVLRKLWVFPLSVAAILGFAHKNCSKLPECYSPESCSGHPRVPESAIKRSTYAKTRFTTKLPFGQRNTAGSTLAASAIKNQVQGVAICLQSPEQ